VIRSETVGERVTPPSYDKLIRIATNYLTRRAEEHLNPEHHNIHASHQLFNYTTALIPFKMNKSTTAA